MGLISRVSSRTYREWQIFQMTTVEFHIKKRQIYQIFLTLDQTCRYFIQLLPKFSRVYTPPVNLLPRIQAAPSKASNFVTRLSGSMSQSKQQKSISKMLNDITDIKQFNPEKFDTDRQQEIVDNLINDVNNLKHSSWMLPK